MDSTALIGDDPWCFCLSHFLVKLELSGSFFLNYHNFLKNHKTFQARK
jgi:hypothetical protein